MRSKTSSKVFGAVLFAMSLFTGCGKEETVKAGYDDRQVAIPVRVEAVQRSTEARLLRYSADLQPDSEVTLAFNVGGYVTNMHRVRDQVTGRQREVDTGDAIRQGTVLTRVRATDFQTGVEAARSQIVQAEAGTGAAVEELTRAEAQLRKAEVDWTRAEALYKERALTRPDYDAARLQVDAAKAQVEAARKNVEARRGQVTQAQAQERQAALTLGDTQLRAPSNGVIIEKSVEIGSLVSPGTPAFRLADVSLMKAVFGVPGTVVATLRRGQPMRVTVDALPNETLDGRITNIGPTAERESRTFSVEVGLPNRQGRLRPGMIGTVEVATGRQEEALTVPFGALVAAKAASDSYNVYAVADEGGKQVARLRRVRLAEVRENRAVITEGLLSGQRVIVRPSNQITDGVLVKAQ